MRHGLIAKSFVPPKPIRALRDLPRYRRKVVESRSAERNRLLKLLETANIKLASVVSDVFGISGLRMLRVILAGTATPSQMAQLAHGRMRSKIPELERAFDGRLEDHYRFLLAMQLARLDQIESHVAQLDERIDQHFEAYQGQRTLLTQIPGVDRILAATLIAELGVDMRVFGSPKRLVAWAGVCPGNYESAGERERPRAPRECHLKTALVEAANAARNQQGIYLKDKFFRLRARRGPQRAALAIGRKILVATYHMLSTGAAYRDLGAASVRNA